MKKDDEDFLNAINKRANLRMIVDSVRYDANGLVGIVAASFRSELIWKGFFPVKENMMLMPFSIGNREYSIEVSTNTYDEVPDSVFINKIMREIKEIMSGKEKFYFTKLTNKVSVKDEVKRLSGVILNDSPSSRTQVSIEWSCPERYVIVGKDKSHLARTTIFIANK